MGPSYGPELPLKGSDVWDIDLYRVHKGYPSNLRAILGTMLSTLAGFRVRV